MNRVFQSFSIYNYRIWFVGILISNVGVWMARIAQDWLVLTELTDNSGFAVGITTGLQFGPQLILAPLAGYIADRYSKRMILFFTQAGLAFIALIQAGLVLSGAVELWHIYVLAGLLGCVAAIDTPARQVFVSEIVDREHLTNAVSLNSVSFNAARLFGPAAAGFVIEWIGPGWALAANSLTYAATIVALSLLHTNEITMQSAQARKSVKLVDGLRYIRRAPQLLIVFALMFIVATLALNFQVTIALFARVQFNRGAGDFGLLNSAMAIGALFGGLVTAGSRGPRLRSIVISTTALGVAMALAALSPNYYVFAVVLIACGFYTIRLATSANAYVQLTTSPRIRGQVMSIYLAIFLGGSPVGSPLVGWVGDTVGPAAALWMGALACLVAALGAGVWALAIGYTTFAAVRRGLHLPEHGGEPPTVTAALPIVGHPETGPIAVPVLPPRDDGSAR